MAERVRVSGKNDGEVDNDGIDAQVSRTGALYTTRGLINHSNKVYSSAAFEVGDSPESHDFFGDTGRVAESGYVVCDGPGDINVQISRDGINYDELIVLKECETLYTEGLYIKKIRIAHSGADSAYRINLI